MFSICRHGAEEVQESEPKKPSASKFAFKGAGYRLGETEDDPTDVVHGAPIREEARKVWHDRVCDKMNNKDYHTIGTVVKSNRKII